MRGAIRAVATSGRVSGRSYGARVPDLVAWVNLARIIRLVGRRAERAFSRLVRSPSGLSFSKKYEVSGWILGSGMSGSRGCDALGLRSL